MRKPRFAAAALALCLLLSGCAAAPETMSSKAVLTKNTITDSLGNTAELPENPRVVALYGSYAQCWLLAGGTLVGATEDAAEEHGIALGEDVQLVGTVKEPSLELIASLNPDYVLLSADLSAHLALDGALTDMQLPHGYFRMDTFDDYDAAMQSFCSVLNAPADVYKTHVQDVRARLEATRAETAAALQSDPPRILLLRAFSTGVKAKTDDNLAGVMLDELGAYNIAYDSPSRLEDLSIEEIVEQDPDFILILTMGSEAAAKSYMEEAFENSPAWSALTAVENGRCIYLPKDLFHYKPLNRWDESYAYLADLLLGKTE